MFKTDALWEESDRSKLLARVFDEPGLRAYRCFEVAINIPLFHLDVLLSGESEFAPSWSRFVLYDLRTILDCIDDTCIKKVRLSIQTPMNIAGKYQINIVNEIYEGTELGGRKFQLCRCVNNENHIFPGGITDFQEPVEKRLVWQAN